MGNIRNNITLVESINKTIHVLIELSDSTCEKSFYEAQIKKTMIKFKNKVRIN